MFKLSLNRGGGKKKKGRRVGGISNRFKIKVYFE